METHQQSEEVERHFIAHQICQSCEACCSVPFILSFIVVLSNIIAILIYCATAPYIKIYVIVSLVIMLCIVTVASGFITYRKVCYASKLQNNLQSSPNEIYDVPWNIDEEEMDYGIINREIEPGLPRGIRETRAYQTSKQRHAKHPVKLQRLETLDYAPEDDDDSFNYFTRRSELVQRQLGNGNAADHSRRSIEESDESQQSHERNARSPNYSLEAAKQPYRIGKRTDRRDENERCSRSRSRSHNMQEYVTEREVLTRNVISKNRKRSKSETRDYKPERSVLMRENLFRSRRQSKHVSPRYQKEEESSSAEEKEMDQYKNIKWRDAAQLKKFDLKIPCRNKDHTIQANKNTVNKETDRQLSQYNRRTMEYPLNLTDIVIPKEEISSSNSKAYKNHPTVHEQYVRHSPLPSGREKRHITPEYKRLVNYSLVDPQRTGNVMLPANSKDGKQNNFESEVAERLPTRQMLSRSQNSIEPKFIIPKFVISDGRHPVRSSMDRVPFSLGRTGNLENPQRAAYPSTSFSTEYLLKCSEVFGFPDQAAVKMSSGAPGSRERNMLNIQVRQNLADCRAADESHAQATNEHKEINQLLNLENNRHVLNERGHSRRMDPLQRRIAGYESGVDDTTDSTESDSELFLTSLHNYPTDSSV